MYAFAERLFDTSHGMKFDTRPKSMYMHLLAFHMKDIQLELLRKMNRNMSSFAMQDCESNNKVKKKSLVSMQSFTH